MRKNFLVLYLFLFSTFLTAQNYTIDEQGIWRDAQTKKEAAFFGVNYTSPFAYAYRAHKKLGIDIKKAIDADVYHFARLGLNAFRIHVWDVEISDKKGNLLNNEHLQLFDYLIAELKKRQIKIILTGIAFWGNGWPETDLVTEGFSSGQTKKHLVEDDQLILAQRNYLKQLLQHTNPFTQKRYQDDEDIIAVEINNEPLHLSSRDSILTYINTLYDDLKGIGLTKPILYNASLTLDYAHIVHQSKVQGLTFQWYPTFLVSGYSFQGNVLPYVDSYTIPFADSLPRLNKKMNIVYEFDAADVINSYVYPAIARSFRSAGIQWATMFAYDPLYLAPYNTEYGTHYLNAIYTPSKAIGLMIAGKVFRRIPSYKKYSPYPHDTLFEQVHLSYEQDLSEMNTETEFYHSNHTNTKPIQPKKLKHIAGVGSSPLMTYQGTGAYFLDKMNTNTWRLEIMPSIVQHRDPFGQTNLDTPVRTVEDKCDSISFQKQGMQIFYPSPAFLITPTTKNQNTQGEEWGDANFNYQKIQQGKFCLRPGIHWISSDKKFQKPHATTQVPDFFIQAHEYVAPQNNTQSDTIKKSIQKKQSLFDADSIVCVDFKKDTNRFKVLYSHENTFNKKEFVVSDTAITGEAKLRKNETIAFHLFIGDKIKSVKNISRFKRVAVKGATTHHVMKLALINKYGNAYSKRIRLNKKENITELKDFIADTFWLLPRPYPDFMPLRFFNAQKRKFKLNEIEKIEISISNEATQDSSDIHYQFDNVVILPH